MSGEVQITITGNLTADPELRTTPSGASVANFTVASTPRTFDRTSNEWRDGETAFLNCSVWRAQADHVVASLRKGDRVIAQGNLKSRSYEKDGQRRTAWELDVGEVGPSLLYAQARAERSSGGQERPAKRLARPARSTDPWGDQARGSQRDGDPWAGAS